MTEEQREAAVFAYARYKLHIRAISEYAHTAIQLEKFIGRSLTKNEQKALMAEMINPETEEECFSKIKQELIHIAKEGA